MSARDGSRAVTSRVRADCRDARALARTEVRAQVRRIRGDARHLASVAAMGAVFGLLFPLLGAGDAVSLGRRLAGGDPAVGTVGAVLFGVFGAGLYGGGSTAVSQTRVGVVGPLVRTSVPPRAVVLGRLASEGVQTGTLAVPAAALLLAAVASGAGGPLVPLALLVASLPVLAAGAVVGRLGGTAVRYAGRRLDVSLWARAVVYLLVVAASMVAIQRATIAYVEASEPGAGFAIPALLPGEPLQAYARVFLAPFGAAPGVTGAAVLAAVVAAAVAGLAATVRIERALLLGEFGDGGETVTDETRGVPSAFDRTPAARIAWRYLVRTTRDPRMLSHLLPLSFGALGMAGGVLQEPRVLVTFGPHGATVLGGLLAGATYCLNPMGDDRDQLPLVLTSARSTAVALRGRALAGTALGLAVAVGLGAPLAVVVGSIRALLVPLAFGPPFALAAAGTALGLGSLVPKFERRDYVNVERAHPSMLLLFGFAFGTLVVGAAGVALFALTVAGSGPLHWLAAGWVVFALVAGGSGVGGYAYAVRKFDALTLDDV